MGFLIDSLFGLCHQAFIKSCTKYCRVLPLTKLIAPTIITLASNESAHITARPCYH